MGILDGQVAIITGAGRGLGRSYALLFAKEGARVMVNDTGCSVDGSAPDPSVVDGVVEEIRRSGGMASGNTVAVHELEGANQLVRNTKDVFGRVDILINNAGILSDRTFLRTTTEDFTSVIDANLASSFYCSQVFARQLIEQGRGGRIVNTTSASGLVGNFGQANYAAASAGIYGLTRTLAIELQKQHITVNAIAPLAKTRITETLPMFQSVSTLTTEHVAPAALFLASDLCGTRTGYVMAVAGARIFAFKVVESPGRFKEGDSTVWSAQEIAEHWDGIVKG